MKKPQEKERSKPAPGQKKFGLGLKIPQIQSPHLELVTPGMTAQTSQTEPVADGVTGQTAQSSTPSVTTPTSHTGQPSPTTHTGQSRQRSQTRQTSQTPTVADSSPIAPVRDYHKYANSITRDAVQANVFGSGKAKQLYDVLYLKTRGAIVPTKAMGVIYFTPVSPVLLV